MQPEEYVRSVNYHGHLVNIGMDDYGQQFFIEYAKDDTVAVVGCGAYSSNYQTVIECCLGKPEYCEKYGQNPVCDDWDSHGFCINCPYNELLIERDKRLKRREEQERERKNNE